MIQDLDCCQRLIENLLNGFIYLKVEFGPQGEPIDYIIQEVNPAFEIITHFKRDVIINRKASEVYPNIRESAFDWFSLYSAVMDSGGKTHFEEFFEPSQRWYEITAYSNKPGYLALIFHDISERVQVYNEMQERERSHSLLLSNLPGIAYRCDYDRNWTMRFISEGCQELTGYKPEELVGNQKCSFNDLISPEYRDWLWDKWQEVLAAKKIFQAEYTIVTATGEIKWVWEQGQGVYDPQGNVLAIEGFISDITDRRRAEKEEHEAREALKESESRFRLFAENAKDLIFRHRIYPEPRFEYVSPSASDIIGYTPEEHYNDPYLGLKITHPQDRWIIEKALSGEINTEEPIVLRWIRKDGAVIWVEHHNTLIYDGDKQIGVEGIVRDITDIKEAQKEVLKRKAHFEALFTNTKDAILFFDSESKVSTINTQYTNMFGYTPEEVEGKDLNAYIDTPRFPDDYVSPRILQGETIEIETERYTKYGEAIPVLIKGGPVNVNGSLTGGYVIYSDITNRKRTEMELKHLSMYDRLTGVYNGTFFEDYMEQLEGKGEYPITILSIDVDGLKIINDTLGHNVGDIHLENCSKILKESLRSKDVLARMGGDEFATILPRTDETAAEQIVRRIYATIEKYNNEYQDKQLSMSIGTATAIDSSRSLQETFKKADDRMYITKLHKGASVKSHIISTLMTTLAERDYITSGHANRLTELSRATGLKIGLSINQLDSIALLAQVHDLGKVGIPDSILFKEGPLNPEEWEIMRQHPEKGYRIASSSSDLAGIAHLILKHHERWDGKGYPLGIQGQDIPIECRIISIIDTYDAITHDRPYRKAKSREEALEEIKRCSGTQFEPRLVEVFLSII